MADDGPRLGDRWRLWDQFALRGAGFPADGVLRLAPEGLVEAADALAAEPPAGPRWQAFEESFGDAAVKTATVLQEIAASSSFRTAVAWQNRAVLASGLDPFLSWIPTVTGRTSMPRQREELVAHYWQRFCVKNDTIGFFGPVGWGRFDPAAGGLLVDPGEGLVAAAELYFSSWAVDTLAKTIGADPRLRPWTAPRRVPFVRLDGAAVTLPGRPPQPLDPAELAVLARCDGTRPAGDLQRELGAAVDVARVLDGLVARRFVVWRLEVPADARPERYLRAWLDGVGDEAARRRGLDLLDVLEHGRELLRAAGDPDALSAAMAALEAGFAGATQAAAAREKGAATAPCRSLVYADCRRSARARLGTDAAAALAPLGPLLDSAAWLTTELAARVMRGAREVFDGLAARAGAGGVDLASFWFACMPVLHGDAVAHAAEVQGEFRRRWAEVLGPVGDAPVRLDGAEVAARVRAAFGDPGGRGPGWTAARYLSPDVMVVATGADAVARGEFELVLGELHLAANTMGASLFVNQHPEPGELLALTARDHPGPRLMPLLAKENKSRLSMRVRHVLVRPEDYHVALVDDTADPRRPRTVRSADVAVELHGDRLVVVLPDGAVFDAVDVFAHVLTTLAMDLFRILPDGDHSPRVTVDRLVVARETWRFVAGDLDAAEERNEARRFVRVRRWRAERGLPRFVFVTSPTEPRPFFVDFASPVYVNIFAKAVRRLARAEPTGRLVVTEMLPTPEQVWLTDDQGNGYTAELRFVAVDEVAVEDAVVADELVVGDATERAPVGC